MYSALRMITIWGFAVLAVLAVGCGSDSKKLEPPAADLAGTWELAVTQGANTCEEVVGTTETGMATIAHESGSNSFTISGEPLPGTMNGTIDGRTMTLTFSGTTSDCSPLTGTATLTLATDNDSATGSANYNCTYTGGSCSGSMTITVTRL